MNWIAIGAVLAMLAIAAGPFGAFNLERRLARVHEAEVRTRAGSSIPAAQKMLADYDTGVRYHLLHALALVVSGVLLLVRPGRWAERAAWCFLAGIVCFSGSLYLYAAGGAPFGWLVLVTRVGHVLFTCGWLCLLFAAKPAKPTQPRGDQLSA